MIFAKKWKILFYFFLGQNDRRNMFHDDLDKKETILE